MASPCEAMSAVLDGNWVGSSTIPAKGLYPHQWSWDTAFISYGHAVTNATRARIEIESLFKGQWSNGLLPHIVFNPDVPDSAYFPGPDYWRSSTAAPDRAPAAPQTSGIVNPPVHASAVLNLMELDPTPETAAFASRLFAPLASWYEYLRSERDPDGNGLVYIRHPWESGMDNSPLWDGILQRMHVPRGSIPPYNRTDLNHSDPADRPSNATYDRFVSLMICARNASYDEAAIVAGECPFVVEDVLFNALYAQGAADLAELARRTGHVADAPKWDGVARRALVSLSTRWNESLGMFADWDVRGGEPISVRSISGFMPLLLRANTLAPLARLIRRHELLHTLTSGGYRAERYGVPSLDPSDGRFSPRLYWRGPAWFNTDWLLLRGLQAHAANDSAAAAEASSLERTMGEFVRRHGAREYWDPATGEPHGTSSFSWTAALYLDTFCANREPRRRAREGAGRAQF
jgi:hypothetical protein